MINQPLHILLLEDNPGDVRIIQVMLADGNGSKFTLESVSRLSKGIERLALGSIDLILLDLSLPDSQGIDTFLELYKHASLIPIVVLTGHSDDSVALKTIHEGAEDYLVKGEINGKLITHCIRYAIERHRLRQALSDQTIEMLNREANFRNLIAKNADAMLIVDKKGVVQFANPAAELLFERTSEDLIGDFFYFPVEDGKISEINITSNNANEITVAEMRVVKTQWGEKAAYLASLRNITDRKRNEEALLTSEERLNAVTHGTLDLISETTIDGHFVYVSPNHFTLLGYKPEELLGKNFFDIIHPEEHQLAAQESELALGSQGFYHMTCRFKHKNGEWHWFESVGRPYKTRTGETRKVAVSRDITERKILEEQLRQSQKMEAIGRLAGGIAHDFNNILTVIIGHTELLQNQTNCADSLSTSIDEIKKAGERAVSLVNQLLAFSRKQVLDLKVINLNAIITNLDKMLQRLIGEDITLTISLNQDIGAVKADPNQLEQVIINIAVNARDAMPHGGQLLIETCNVTIEKEFSHRYPFVIPGQYVVLTVSDTGFGMDPETQTHIFEPFFTTKEQGKGTGLGLPTVYGIVKQSGGYIFVDSEPEQGATFKVYLPQIYEPVDPCIVPPKTAEFIKGEETILVIEDEDGVRALITEMLKRHGYCVLEAANGTEAIETSKQYPNEINLVLTDVVIPGISGREAIHHIMPLQPNAKVIYMSGYSDEAIMQHGVIEPETSFIQKPFTRAILLQKVREILDS